MFVFNIPPLLTMCACAAVAVFAARRCRRSRHCRLFAWVCALAAIMYADMLVMFNVRDPRWALIIHRLDRIVTLPLMPLYIQFFHEYLGISRRRWLVVGVWTLSLGLMAMAPTPLLIAGVRRYPYGYFGTGGAVYPLMAVTALFSVLYAMGLLARAMAAETMTIRKHRLAYLMAGFGTAGLLTGLNVLPAIGIHIYPPGSFAFVPLAVLAIGLFRHDLLDIGLILNRGVVYSLATAGMTVVCAGLITLTQAGLTVTAGPPTAGVLFVSFLAAAVVFGPLRQLIQTGVDRLFHQSRMVHRRVIGEVSRMVTSLRSMTDIGHHLTRSVTTGLHLTHCRLYACVFNSGPHAALIASAGSMDGAVPTSVDLTPAFRRHSKGHRGAVIRSGLPNDVLRERTSAFSDLAAHLDAAVLLPLMYRGKINGLIVIGEKQSGTLFAADDVKALETLANQTALAIENAAVCDQLHALNVELEQRVEERTRALRDALREKERTQEQLVRSESLAAIGELVAGVAHELNNPLASVKSLLQSAIEELSSQEFSSSSPGDLVDDLVFADSELNRAAEIVSALLGLTRQAPQYSESVNLNTVIRDAMRVLHSRYKHRPIDIEKSLDDALPEIQGNFAQLGQAVMNIVHNALQAVDGEGRIRLHTEYDRLLKRVVFACTDNGAGVPEAIQRDIFKPFFTTKPVGEGTGLGLYIAHTHVARHGGTIAVSSVCGEGTSMTVSLPAHA